jgi:hypothetical protein
MRDPEMFKLSTSSAASLPVAIHTSRFDGRQRDGPGDPGRALF